MMKTAKPIAMVAALCLSVLSATAAEQSGTDEERDACTPDVYKFCSSEIPDEKRIVACLKRNKEKLSRACYKVFFEPK